MAAHWQHTLIRRPRVGTATEVRSGQPPGVTDWQLRLPQPEVAVCVAR
jgi:hypothetical protein